MSLSFREQLLVLSVYAHVALFIEYFIEIILESRDFLIHSFYYPDSSVPSLSCVG